MSAVPRTWWSLGVVFGVPVLLVYSFTAVPVVLRDVWRRESSVQVLVGPGPDRTGGTADRRDR